MKKFKRILMPITCIAVSFCIIYLFMQAQRDEFCTEITITTPYEKFTIHNNETEDKKRENENIIEKLYNNTTHQFICPSFFVNKEKLEKDDKITIELTENFKTPKTSTYELYQSGFSRKLINRGNSVSYIWYYSIPNSYERMN